MILPQDIRKKGKNIIIPDALKLAKDVNIFHVSLQYPYFCKIEPGVKFMRILVVCLGYFQGFSTVEEENLVI